MITIKKLIYLMFCLLYLTACQLDSSSSLAKDSLFTSVNTSPLIIANDDTNNYDLLTEVKQKVANFPEIYDVVVIQNKNDVLVVYKVKQMQRFKMKKISTKVNKELQHSFPELNFIVSSDLKIFLEAVELISQVNDNNYPTSKAKKWFGSIVELQKDAI